MNLLNISIFRIHQNRQIHMRPLSLQKHIPCPINKIVTRMVKICSFGINSQIYSSQINTLSSIHQLLRINEEKNLSSPNLTITRNAVSYGSIKRKNISRFMVLTMLMKRSSMHPCKWKAKHIIDISGVRR